MRKDMSITLSETDRQRLEALVADRNAPQKHVWRARIVLLSADGVGANAIIDLTSPDERANYLKNAGYASVKK